MSENESAADEPRKQANPERKAAAAPGNSDSFTQVFESLKKEEGVPRRRNDSGTDGGLGNGGTPNVPQAAGEGFMQIFESVKGGRQSTPPRGESVRFPASDSGALPALHPKNSEGEFTRLLRKVSRKPNAAKTASSAPAPKPGLRADGPGEFTRIVSQSMRREARSPGQNKVLPETREPIAAQPDKGGAEHSPKNEQASAAPPINPQGMLYSAQEAVRIAGGGGSLSRSAEQVAYTAASRASAAKNASAPRLASESRFHEYVPLLLMANLFLTVLLLLLVCFALLHRP